MADIMTSYITKFVAEFFLNSSISLSTNLCLPAEDISIFLDSIIYFCKLALV
ncbi:hypothetical protein NOVO_04065 [Rickettsiales bacterium Ac37b]|nr:hypothetical protein NOVO_04065 [Rickettsiales bacterium Ac37b]